MKESILPEEMKDFDFSDYPIEYIEPATQAFKMFLTWWNNNDIKPFASELNLVSEKWQVGGTPDMIVLINGELCIWDLKTGKEVRETDIAQLDTYKEFWNELYPEHPIEAFHILRTGKEISMFSHNYYKDFPGAFRVFELCHELYQLGKEINKLK